MAKISVKDPLDLTKKEIQNYRNKIICLLIKLGKSRKKAVRSADLWEQSLEKTKKEFGNS